MIKVIFVEFCIFEVDPTSMVQCIGGFVMSYTCSHPHCIQKLMGVDLQTLELLRFIHECSYYVCTTKDGNFRVCTKNHIEGKIGGEKNQKMDPQN